MCTSSGYQWIPLSAPEGYISGNRYELADPVGMKKMNEAVEVAVPDSFRIEGACSTDRPPTKK